MSTRVYLALDLTRTEGRGLSEDALLEIVEEELADYAEGEGSHYDVAVLGIGTSVQRLTESIRLRRQAPR